MDEPSVKEPEAMMILLSYPGISHGSGRAMESTGEPLWTPWQKAMSDSGFRSSTDWMMSALSSFGCGVTP